MSESKVKMAADKFFSHKTQDFTMNIRLAHLRDQGIDFAVFDADATSHIASDRAEVLEELISIAKQNGLKVDKAALAYRRGGRTEFFGTPDLVRYLSNRGVPRWTHVLNA